MPKSKKSNVASYSVGYRKPPVEHQFKKGTSGNPAGASSKHKREPIDVDGILNEPLDVNTTGGRQKMTAYEVGVRQLVNRALKEKNLNAILELIALCESFRLLVPAPIDRGGGVIVAPRGVDYREWLESVTELVPDTPPEEDDDFH